MLCMNPLDELFEFAEDIDGVAMAKEKRRGCWNNGSMIIGNEFLNKKVYSELLQFDHKNPVYNEYFGHDQKIYNIYFGRGDIKKVHQKFNTLVSEADFISNDQIVIMHYFYKPTQEVGRRHLATWMIDLWEKYDDPDGRYSKVYG